MPAGPAATLKVSSHMQAKAVFFDLDGTLLDSLEDLADTTNTALEAHGFPARPVGEYRYFVGDGIRNMLRRAAPPGTDESAIDRLVARARQEYGLHWARKTALYDGIGPMLARLRRKNVPLAVLSNKPHDFCLAMTAHFFPDAPFAVVAGSPPDGRAKPEPEMALRLARTMNLDPAEVLFMGDTRTDMDTAVNAGMVPVGVLWGFRPESELRAHGAQALLRNPSDLFGIPQVCGAW